MGTSYTARGDITITPPLNFAEIKKAENVAMGMLRAHDVKRTTPEMVFDFHMPLKLEVENEVRETDEGLLTVTKAVSVIPAGDQISLSYDPGDLLVALQKALPGHTWSGEITAVHEDRYKAYRYTCDPKDTTSLVTVLEGTVVVRWPGEENHDQDITDLL